MPFPWQPAYIDVRTRAAWQTQVAMAKRMPGLLPLLVRQRHNLVPRFAQAYQQLRILPKRVRRQLQRRWRRPLAGVALLVALGQGTVWADTINVDGITCTLINAITTANTDTDTGGCVQLPKATAGADTIVLQAGSIHTLTAVNDTNKGRSGLPAINSEITIEGNNSTITRASGAPNFRLLAVDSGGQFVLKNTTLSGGLLPTSVRYSNGGGLANRGGQVTLEKCTVTGNFVFGSGGGVYNYLGTLSLIDSVVSGNSAGFGGGAANFNGTLLLTNSTVSGNSASSGGGVDSSSFLSSFSTLIVTNSVVTGNSARVIGGGIDNFGTTLTMTNSTVSRNTAAYHGGGIANTSATMTVTHSTISGNSARFDGGGIDNFRATITVTNSTVSGNSARLDGGGVYNYSSIVTLLNSTVAANTAERVGGGVYNRNAFLVLLRSLLSGNTASSGAEVYHNAGTVTVDNFNLFGHAALTTAQALAGFSPGATDITATSNGTTPTALSAILDPTLADNGGPTYTHTLVTGSPAIDASPADSDCQPDDQRSVPRPQGAACDIGAVELVPGVAIPAEVCGDRTPTIGCTVNGHANQLCFSTSDRSTIVGSAGADVIVATGKNNTLKGGEGDDCIIGGPGKDRIEGQDGNDVIFGGGGNAQVRGGKGNDLIVTDNGNDNVQGDEGMDLLFDSGGSNTLKGRADDDVIVAPEATGTIDGGSGDDECIGGTKQVSCP